MHMSCMKCPQCGKVAFAPTPTGITCSECGYTMTTRPRLAAKLRADGNSSGGENRHDGADDSDGGITHTNGDTTRTNGGHNTR